MSESEDFVERPTGRTADARPYREYAILLGLYQALFGGFLLLYRGKKNRLEQLTALDLVMLGLATLRISKTISEDEITEVVRRPLVEQEGESKQPRGRGFRWTLGRLILCPTCTGTWVAAFLGYGLHLSPQYTRPLLAVMAASGIEQFSDAILSLVYVDRNVKRKLET